VIVPTIPLLFAIAGVVAIESGYELSVRLTMALLFLLAVMLSRRDGLTWVRAVVAGLVIVSIAMAVIWLEAQVH
jgi:hypothetical protein